MKKLILFLFLCASFGVFAQDTPGIYTIKNVKINTSHSDFGTAFLGNDKVVFAAPRDGFTLNREEYKGQPFLDLHVAEVSEDGKLIKKQKLPGDVNTKYHEGMVTFSKDMKTVYFSANGKIKRTKRKKDKDSEVKTKGTANIHLFKAIIDENGDWGNLEMLPFNDDSYSTGHPVLNRDDTKLYFVSDSPESLGQTDIFVVDLYEDGTYGQPVNLGPKINTIGREMFPFIGKDNVLYYASDGLSGFGELDIFASKIFDNTVSDPINLEEPVNSISDDFAYIIDDHKHKGYFSSNREGGKGDDDIYSFTASPPIYIECQQEITGVVKNIDTQELISNVTIILFDEDGEKLQSFMSNEDGASFSFMQSCDTNYKIQGFLEGYLVGEMDIQTVNDLNAEPVEIVLNMRVDPNLDPNIIAEATEVNKVDSQEMDEEQISDSQIASEGNAVISEENVTSVTAVVASESVGDQEQNNTITQGEQVTSGSIASAEVGEKDSTISTNSTVEVPSTTAKNSSPVVIAAAALVPDNDKNASSEKEAIISDSAEVSEVTNSEESFEKESIASNSSDVNSPAVIAAAALVSDNDKNESSEKEAMISDSAEVSEVTNSEESFEKESIASSGNDVNSSAVIAAAALVPDNDKNASSEKEAIISDSAEASEVTDSEENFEKESIASSSNDVNSQLEIAETEVQESEITEATGAIPMTVSSSEESINEVVSEKEDNSKDTQLTNVEIEDKSVNNSLDQESLTVESAQINRQTVSSNEGFEQTEQLSSSKNIGDQSSVEKEAEVGVVSNTKNVAGSDLAINYEQSKVDLDGLKINTIYFDFDKHKIRYDAKIELDKLINVMKEYPEMKIEVNAHTDLRGKKKYNDGLSNKRADATTSYLVENGVDSKRISSYWFGELRPAEKCTKESPCSGFQHQLNRRSEFAIIDKSSDQIIVKSVNRKNTLNQQEKSYTSNSGLFMNYNFYKDKEVYTVQIGAFKGKVQTNKYSKLTNLFNHKYDDGLNRYYSGIFETSSEARNHMRLMRKNGYAGAFVVGLKGENRF